jgi:hypothetical protein
VEHTQFDNALPRDFSHIKTDEPVKGLDDAPTVDEAGNNGTRLPGWLMPALVSVVMIALFISGIYVAYVTLISGDEKPRVSTLASGTMNQDSTTTREIDAPRPLETGEDFAMSDPAPNNTSETAVSQDGTAQASVNAGEGASLNETSKIDLAIKDVATAPPVAKEIPPASWSGLQKIEERMAAIESRVSELKNQHDQHVTQYESLKQTQQTLSEAVEKNAQSTAALQSRIDSIQSKLGRINAKPKTESTGLAAQTSNNKTATANTDKKRTAQALPSKVVEIPAVVPATRPVKPALQDNIRLVSLKQLQGRATVVMRIGGEFSPMLQPGQVWRSYRIIAVSLPERSVVVAVGEHDYALYL